MNIVVTFSSDFNHDNRPELGDDAEIPRDFDPATFPIIARHFYGWCPVGAVAAGDIVKGLHGDHFPPSPVHEVLS